MSEIKKVLQDKLPPKLYLDTSYLVDVLIQTKENPIKHNKAVQFSERLQQSKTTIICSKLCYIEFWNAAFKIKLRDVCGNDKLSSIIGNARFLDEVFKWTEEQHKNLMLFLEALTKRPDLKITESIGIYGMGTKIHDRAREVAIKYRLPIYDAVHYDTMLQTNTVHIVTENISDFKHLRNIYIWSYR